MVRARPEVAEVGPLLDLAWAWRRAGKLTKARAAVRKAIVRAIGAISDVDEELGAHLLSCITTGAVCRYTPTDGWALEAVS